jgi:hypothetical protein
MIDGGGSTPSVNANSWVVVPYGCTITGWHITSDVSGSAVVDVLKSTYAGFPSFTSIAGTEKPTLSSAQKNQDTSLSTWTATITAGDYIKFNLDSVATVTYIYVSLDITKT